jgi:hypothetical protein
MYTAIVIFILQIFFYSTDLEIGSQDLTGCRAVDPPSNQGTSSGLKVFLMIKSNHKSNGSVGDTGTILRNESYEELMAASTKKLIKYTLH